jgi:hypothetical protein
MGRRGAQKACLAFLSTKGSRTNGDIKKGGFKEKKN